MSFCIIETERLVLRPFTEEDAYDVLEYLSEPAVNCFACMKLNSLEEAIMRFAPSSIENKEKITKNPAKVG